MRDARAQESRLDGGMLPLSPLGRVRCARSKPPHGPPEHGPGTLPTGCITPNPANAMHLADGNPRWGSLHARPRQRCAPLPSDALEQSPKSVALCSPRVPAGAPVGVCGGGQKSEMGLSGWCVAFPKRPLVPPGVRDSGVKRDHDTPGPVRVPPSGARPSNAPRRPRESGRRERRRATSSRLGARASASVEGAGTAAGLGPLGIPSTAVLFKCSASQSAATRPRGALFHQISGSRDIHDSRDLSRQH